jgi:hypothetical protein
MNFADKYAEASITPGAEIIGLREASLDKVPEELTFAQTLGLCRFYFGLPGDDIEWFVEHLRQDDASYSLIANRRETALLAAEVLSRRIADESPVDLLAVLVTSAMGTRTPATAAWLVAEAKQEILEQAVGARAGSTRPVISKPVGTKVGDDLKTWSEDAEAQRALLVKLRNESFGWSGGVANQAGTAMGQLHDQLALLKEETSILWWLFGETSNLLEEPYSDMPAGTAELLAGFDLGSLTTSELGPVSADAMMSRMVRLSKKARGKVTLASALEGFAEDQTKKLALSHPPGFDDVFLIHTALGLCADVGAPAWRGAFQKRTGFDPEHVLEPRAARQHAYHEYLLARLSPNG